MTSIDGLFPHASTQDDQWRLQTLLLCNWGGFGGVHTIEFDPDTTLLSGASGAGKSTILDAYTTLINPNLPLNSASNEAGARSRGDGTRSTLTYVRGQYDYSEVGDVLVPLVLRGEAQDTWSLIAAVFTSDNGTRTTFLRAWHAPKDVATPGDMKALYGQFAGTLKPGHITEHFEPIAHQFNKTEVEKLRGMTVLSATAYATDIQKKLNIGAHGDGAKALRLLYDLQAGKPVDRVSKLFRDMVLETPATFDVADKVIASFDGLDDMHQQMKRAEDQVATLNGIDDDHDLVVEAQAEISRLDILGVNREQSPYGMWATRYRDQLCADEIDVLTEEHTALLAAAEAADTRARNLELERGIVDEQWRAEGGDAVKTVNDAIERLTRQEADVRAERDRYAQQTAALNQHTPDTLADFHTAQAHARKRQADYDLAKAELKQAARAATLPYGKAQADLRSAEAELEHLTNQQGNIPRTMHEVRLQWAEISGIPAENLQFAGELIDMHDDWESWRTAADSVLGSLATTLLVDENQRRHLQRSINDRKFATRLRFRGATVHDPQTDPASDDTLAGRVTVKDSPFAGWLRRHLDTNFRHECVETADQLGNDNTPRVTRNGQTQVGRSGAHGGNIGRRIGFSNMQRRAELSDEIADLRQEIRRLEDDLDRHDEAERKLDDEHSASNWITGARWTDLDLNTIVTDLADQIETRNQLRASSNALDVLTNQMERLGKQISEAERAGWEHQRDAEQRHNGITELQSARDMLTVELAVLDADDSITLTDKQSEALDHELGRVDWDGTLQGFKLALTIVRERLTHTSDDATSRMTAALDRITSRFARFHGRWPDNNRGTSLAAYDDYLKILDDLRSSGIADQRRSWARAVIEWSGEDLSDLVQSYSKARFEIDERLRPIRRILASIPFGRRGTTLDVAVTHRSPEPVRVFMEQLRTLAKGTMSPNATDDEIMAKFEKIRGAVAHLRRDNSDRAMLLDVRRHLEAKAKAVTDGITGGPVYDHLGNKSGGESQLLTAFIVGAALRYHLGDENRNRPRYAPVVLDEAFIKADGEYTAQAVEAWKQLGFQLVVGAPEDKFNALEPSMALVIGITKDNDEFSYATATPKVHR